MTAARLLQRVESYGLTLREEDGHLVVTGQPSRETRLLIGAHRGQLLSVLRGQDVPLSSAHSRAHLQSLGLVLLHGAWTSDLGDEHAEQILCGDITFESARAAVVARTHQAQTLAHAAGLRPRTLTPVEDVQLVPKGPGRFAYSIERGKHYRRLPHEEDR